MHLISRTLQGIETVRSHSYQSTAKTLHNSAGLHRFKCIYCQILWQLGKHVKSQRPNLFLSNDICVFLLDYKVIYLKKKIFAEKKIDKELHNYPSKAVAQVRKLINTGVRQLEWNKSCGLQADWFSVCMLVGKKCVCLFAAGSWGWLCKEHKIIVCVYSTFDCVCVCTCSGRAAWLSKCERL